MNPEFEGMLRPFLKYVGEQELTAESRLRELGLDSMQEIELLFAIEDTFGVQLPDELLTETTFATAGNLWQAISDLDGAADGAARS
ncbi:phosphopantetheine-binding protein [Streptomyces sp. NPDC101160]|uniref:phosphopantetheine-binding protein n=1 Tax=Streptomyces sp. NPDC101160 TaxID=3366118 RepID=UPI00381D729F